MVIRSSLRRAVTAVFVGCGVVLGTGAAADRTAVPVVSGTATAAPAVSGTATAATVTALVADDPRGALTALPAGFAEVMGYSPVLEPGFGRGPVLADPRGDCSSPVPLPAAFEPACRVHDLGYDLLRYGRDTDGELGAWARRDLDTQLQRNLHDVCAGEPGPARATCRVAADVAVTAVRINSWRQGYRLPHSDSPVAALAAVAAAAAAGTALVRRRAA